jgi:hypothetical protein
MRLAVFISSLGFAAIAVAQQPQQQPPQQKPQEQQQIDKQTLERLRVERAAGGVRELTPEEKASANAGAGPHRSRPQSGQSDERVEDKTGGGEQSSRGATR